MRVPWNKGLKGVQKVSEETRRKHSLSAKGRKHSPETLEKMRVIKLGVNNPNFGKKLSIEHRMKIADSQKGIKHYLWIEDRSKLKRSGDANKDRRSSAYGDWRKEVYTRDGFKCKINNSDCMGRIEAHHILGWTKFIELRYDVNNGITLCKFHHPRKKLEEKRLEPIFRKLVSVSK